MSIQRLIDIVQEAYPDTEVLIRTNVQGRITIRDPQRETVIPPARYFVNVFRRNTQLPVDHPGALDAYRAYGPTMEQALVAAITLRDPELLTSRGYRSHEG